MSGKAALRRVEDRFAKLAAESRKHPAYWRALAKLEYDEVKYDRDRYRRWMRHWAARSAGSVRVTGGIIWAAVDLGELRAALRGEAAPRRKR